MRLATTVWIFIAAASLCAGCSKKEVEAPKKDLSERDKQQIRELNEQRAQEWASTKRK
jgi:hypothetical protein